MMPTVGVVDAAALLVSGAAVVAGLVALVVTREIGAALAVLLDMLLAAGLLRLSHAPTPGALATAASIILVRKLVGIGLAAGRGVRSVGDEGVD